MYHCDLIENERVFPHRRCGYVFDLLYCKKKVYIYSSIDFEM